MAINKIELKESLFRREYNQYLFETCEKMWKIFREGVEEQAKLSTADHKVKEKKEREKHALENLISYFSSFVFNL